MRTFEGTELKIALGEKAIFEDSHPTGSKIRPGCCLLASAFVEEHGIEDLGEEAAFEWTISGRHVIQNRIEPLSILQLKTHFVGCAQEPWL